MLYQPLPRHAGVLPDDSNTLSKLVFLIRIASCERLFRHVGTLPDDTKTLSKLVSLTDERFQELIDNGIINPNMGRKDMDAPKISKKAWVTRPCRRAPPCARPMAP